MRSNHVETRLCPPTQLSLTFSYRRPPIEPLLYHYRPQTGDELNEGVGDEFVRREACEKEGNKTDNKAVKSLIVVYFFTCFNAVCG